MGATSWADTAYPSAAHDYTTDSLWGSTIVLLLLQSQLKVINDEIVGTTNIIYQWSFVTQILKSE
jgi:hypothetical protein